MKQTIQFQAMMFAREKHKNHARKYTGTPYIEHLAEVAALVGTAYSVNTINSEVQAIAWLHDSVEDQGVIREELEDRFGQVIADGVLALSDLEQGNRAYRKEQSRLRLSKAPSWIQTIKCADLISNTKSIVEHDHKFAVVYLQEKLELLEVLKKADVHLWNLAYNQAIEGRQKLRLLGYKIKDIV